MAELTTVRIERADGVAWVILNRPDKRNAMSPTLNREMMLALDEVEADGESEVLVLTGAGEAFSAGMDLKEYFREIDGQPSHVQAAVRRQAGAWQLQRLRSFPLPTIAMVNGWCFGGAFTPLICCDLALAAEDAVFGLSEINWGIIPGGVVPKATVDAVMSTTARRCIYIMTGRTVRWEARPRRTGPDQPRPCRAIRAPMEKTRRSGDRIAAGQEPGDCSARLPRRAPTSSAARNEHGRNRQEYLYREARPDAVPWSTRPSAAAPRA